MNKSKAQDIRILVIDDEPMMSDSLRRHLEEEGYAIDTAATGAEAIDLFDGGAHHLVICDLQLPDMDGLTLLRHMKDSRPTTEVIVITGYGSVQTAVEATKAGAFYFVEKPFDFEELSPLVEKALERRELITETANMRRQLSTRAEYFNIIGSSKQMQTIYETIESVAKSDANVLIVGESGTGKELIANAIHYNSLRAKKPFIKVNCAALPKELIESELFGHTKGAFTGAHADKEGLVQHAAGGSPARRPRRAPREARLRQVAAAGPLRGDRRGPAHVDRQVLEAEAAGALRALRRAAANPASRRDCGRTASESD